MATPQMLFDQGPCSVHIRERRRYAVNPAKCSRRPGRPVSILFIRARVHVDAVSKASASSMDRRSETRSQLDSVGDLGFAV
jgi:hypothetical protein